MALRAFAFSVRLRDGGERTLRIQNDPKDPSLYVLEDVREGEKKLAFGRIGLCPKRFRTVLRPAQASSLTALQSSETSDFRKSRLGFDRAG